MEEKIKLIANSFGFEKIKFNEPLSSHTVLKLGGTALMFAVTMSEREIIKLVEECVQLNVPYQMIGTGSKVVFSDDGFDGVVIKNRTQNIRITSIKGQVSKKGLGVASVLLEVESGMWMGKFVEFLEKQGLESSDFEGVVGSIGGNISTNRSLLDKCESIKILNSLANIEIISPSKLNLREDIVISVVLRIKAK